MEEKYKIGGQIWGKIEKKTYGGEGAEEMLSSGGGGSGEGGGPMGCLNSLFCPVYFTERNKIMEFSNGESARSAIVRPHFRFLDQSNGRQSIGKAEREYANNQIMQFNVYFTFQ